MVTEPDSQPRVALRGAVAVLGRFPALSGVDLSVDAGEIVLIEGPNGAGKTSLLRVCAGLLGLERGTGSIDGHDLGADRHAVRRSVGYLGHHLGLYEELTARDNVRYWAAAAGMRPQLAESALEELGLTGRLVEVPVSRLSAGQRRRAALSALVARRPRVWLLDEPHAALDEPARDLLDRLIVRAGAGGAAVLVASHEIDRVAVLAHRRVVLAGGHVVSDDVAGGSAAAPLEAVDG